jgi:hypothetical protein
MIFTTIVPNILDTTINLDLKDLILPMGHFSALKENENSDVT